MYGVYNASNFSPNEQARHWVSFSKGTPLFLAYGAPQASLKVGTYLKPKSVRRECNAPGPSSASCQVGNFALGLVSKQDLENRWFPLNSH